VLKTEQNNVTVRLWQCGAVFAAVSPMYNAFQLQYYSLAEDEIFNFLLKLELQLD
jgi:hypothetical protein